MLQKLPELLDRALFGPHVHEDTLAARLLRALRYPYAITRDLLGGQLTLRATGLVYITLLALIPLIALSFALLKAFDAERMLEPFLLEFFRPLGDSGIAVVERLMDFGQRVSGGLVGMVGLVLLLWTLVGTVTKVEESLNFVWRVQRARSMTRRMMEFIALVTLGPLVVAAVITFSKLAFDSVASHTPTDFTLWAKAMKLMIRLAPYGLVTLLFTAIYMLMPNTRVRLLPALGGALAAGICWAAAGMAFTALVIYSSRLTLVYAGFTVVVTVFLWTYLGWLILLAGAQLAFYLQNPAYLRLGHAVLRLSGAEQERLALDIMTRVAQSHRAGDPPWTIERLGHALALPGIAVADMGERLERAGLLAQADDGKIFPGREIAGISLEQIVDCARNQHTAHELHPLRSAGLVKQLQAELEQAWRKACRGRSLADLISDDD